MQVVFLKMSSFSSCVADDKDDVKCWWLQQQILYGLVCVEQGMKEVGALISSVFLQKFFYG